MRKQSHSRTLSVVLTLMLFVAFNTVMQLSDLYSEWFAWVMYGRMVIAAFVVLRYQRRLTATFSAIILALPFVLAALGGLIRI
jgi:hypothetical protein